MFDTEADTHTGTMLMMTFSDAVAKVAEQVTELGLTAEEMLRFASSALFGRQYLASAEHVLAEAPRVIARYVETQQRLMELLAISMPTSDEIRWAVELRQMGLSFRTILDHCMLIARHAISLDQNIGPGTVDDVLAQADMDHELLLNLVRLPLQQTRDAIFLSTSRSTFKAQALIEANGQLSLLYTFFHDRMTQAIAAYPLASYPLQLVLLIATQFEAIGNCAASAGAAVLGRTTLN